MVLPWLIVGACSALEMRRRKEPETSGREVRRLQDVQKLLQRQKEALATDFKVHDYLFSILPYNSEALCHVVTQPTCLQKKEKEIREAKTTNEVQIHKLAELEEMKVQYEDRLTDLNSYAEALKEENDTLRETNRLIEVDNAEWKARADEYLNQNIALQGDAETLRIENGDLKQKVPHRDTATSLFARCPV
jgi:hypothetical protein